MVEVILTHKLLCRNYETLLQWLLHMCAQYMGQKINVCDLMEYKQILCSYKITALHTSS